MSSPRMCQCHDLWPNDQSRSCVFPLGRRYRLVRIVPESMRGSARASGTYDCYGGVQPVQVSEPCYLRWVRDAVREAGEFGLASDLAAHGRLARKVK